MKRKRYTTEQIIAILRQADTGKTVEEICRGNNVSEQTFYRWRKKYGNLELADAKRFKDDVTPKNGIIYRERLSG